MIQIEKKITKNGVEIKNGYVRWDDLSIENKKTTSFPRNNSVSGYGKKIPTDKLIKIDGKWLRVYCCIYSNNGTCYVRSKKYGKIIVH